MIQVRLALKCIDNTLCTVNDVTGKESLEIPLSVFPASVGGISLEKTLEISSFEGLLYVIRPHRGCKDPSGSFQEVFPYDIIDST